MKLKTPHGNKFPRLGSLVLILGCASPQQLLAQTDFFWSGTTSNSFNLGSNWTGGTAPGTGTTPTTSTNTDVAVFNNSSRAADDVLTGSIALGSARNLGGFRFTGASVGSYSFNDTNTNRFNLTLGGSILMDSAVPTAQKFQRIGFTGSTGDYTLENNATSSAATLTIASTVASATTGTANLILTGTNTGSNAITNVISDASLAGALSIIKNGAGTWIIGQANANTFRGTTTLNSGTLGLASSNALSTGNLTINGGRIGSAGASSRTLTNNISIGGDFFLGGVASLGITLNGTMDLGGAVRSITLDNSATIGGIISNGGLTKLGSATLTLSAANDYTGATTVSNGVLAVSSTGTLNTSSGVTINGGTFRYNSSTNLSPGVTFTSGTVAGTNWNGNLAGLTIGTGQTISPGDSPGTATTTSQTWAGGGSYLWEINNATGTAGMDPGWDLLSGTDTLDITSTSFSPFNILVTSLTLANVNGLATNFSDLTSYNWLIADFATINGFDATDFNINTSAFTNSFTGTFGVSLGGVGDLPGADNQIYLTYTAIPEPSAALLGGLGLLALLRRRATR